MKATELVVNLLLSVFADEPQIFVAAENTIWRMNLNGTNKIEFASAVNATSLDFHYAKGLLFWSDVATHKVYSKNLFDETAEVKTVIKGANDWTPRAIAVDYIHDKIYVMDQTGDKIDLFELDGRKSVIGIKKGIIDPLKTDTHEPHVLDIVVDPIKNELFYGAYKDVMKASLDFSTTRKIGYKSIATGLGLDRKKARVYYTDDHDIVHEANYNGIIYSWINAYDHPAQLIKGTRLKPRSMAVFDSGTATGGKYYFLDNKATLPGLQKLVGYYPRKVDENLKNGWAVRIVHSSLQKN